MDLMTDDNDRIDEIIRKEAGGYNRPGDVPRDEMWNAIQAARQSTAAGPRLLVSAGSPSRSTNDGYSVSHRSAPRYAWFGLAAAAVLLVATGVGIGRWTSSGSEGPRRVADAPSQGAPVVQGDGIVVTGTPQDVEPAQPGPNAAPASGQAASQQPVRPAGRTREEIRRNPVVKGNGGLRLVNGGGSTLPAPAGGVQAVSYQVATQQHLQQAEALLTSFAIESRDERMNSQFAGWAKGLLSNTRLLLDSPAGDDPRRAKLLQDLEQVLAQIVQLAPDAPAADRELVQGSIQNGLVITRLRSAIPADQAREITER
jgi:hypothetical protein